MPKPKICSHRRAKLLKPKVCSEVNLLELEICLFQSLLAFVKEKSHTPNLLTSSNIAEQSLLKPKICFEANLLGINLASHFTGTFFPNPNFAHIAEPNLLKPKFARRQIYLNPKFSHISHTNFSKPKICSHRNAKLCQTQNLL